MDEESLSHTKWECKYHRCLYPEVAAQDTLHMHLEKVR